MQIEELLTRKAQKSLFRGQEEATFRKYQIDHKALKEAIEGLLACKSTTVEVWVYLDDLVPISMRVIAYSQYGYTQRVVLHGGYQPVDSPLPTAQLAMVLMRSHKIHPFKPQGNVVVCSPDNEVALECRVVVI